MLQPWKNSTRRLPGPSTKEQGMILLMIARSELFTLLVDGGEFMSNDTRFAIQDTRLVSGFRPQAGGIDA